MLRSRVLSGIDTARLANAVARPGIDPRIWVSYAVLTSDPVVVTEANEQDVVVDIMLLPSGTLETARVGATYAGNGFGLYAPLYKDDEVLVAAPSGDPDEGLVVIQRLWSPADLPPDSIAQNPEDWTLIVKEGKNLRLNVQGAGNVYLTADTGKVYLGDAAATKAVARVDDTVAADTTPPVLPATLNMQLWMTAVTAAINTLIPNSIPDVPTTVGTISSGAAKVVAS